MYRNLLLLAPLAVGLAGCSSSEPEEETIYIPAPTPTETETPTPTPEPSEEPTAEGEWIATIMADRPAAMFGPLQSEPAFSLHCEEGVLIFIRSVFVDAEAVEMVLTVGGEQKSLEAEAAVDPMPEVTASLPASDPFATRLALAYDPIAVTVNEGLPFRMPASDALRNTARACTL